MTVTLELLLRALREQNVRIPAGTAPEKVLAKQTHLHLNGMRISLLSKELKAVAQRLEVGRSGGRVCVGRPACVGRSGWGGLGE